MTLRDEALNHLRLSLLELKASGPEGFEGLVAECLSAFSGLTFRLARSGSQFGRDASSPPAAFAISMEAKRYTHSPRLEDLLGKVDEAAHELANDIDVWVLAVTAGVGDNTVSRLTKVLEERGITLLTLDWSRPMPPLAVLLAASKNAALAWFQHCEPAVNRDQLARCLDVIASDVVFSAQVEALRVSITASRVGLDALRRRSAEWLRRRFSDRDLSRIHFGQFVTISDERQPAVPRTALVQTLDSAVRNDPSGNTVFVVLGDEGSGKTWLVAQWWATLVDQPIMIFVSGRRAEQLAPEDPIESAARFLAEQDGQVDEVSLRGWKRRLRRWQGCRSSGALRFVLVLDGLNEHGRTEWADIISGHRRVIEQLGGVVIATTRDGFWRRDVIPRLPGTFRIARVNVEGYSDVELGSLLAHKGVGVADLPSSVREFVRNPRVCSVALGVLDRLKLQPNELTVERLLLEYWQARLRERGDLIAHTVSDFEKLLRSHARAALAQPRGTFGRDDWMAHSGAAKRRGIQDVQNDLTEIEEGRFLTIDPTDVSSYVFRPEVLPFALALFINEELAAELRAGDGITSTSVDDVLSRILDPIRGFDAVGNIVAAAVGLSCYDASYPSHGREALIRAWFGLQNVSDQAEDSMLAYLSYAPDAFLDVLEGSETSLRHLTRLDSLAGFVTAVRSHPRVSVALERRLPRWLGRWSRVTSTAFGNDQAHAKRHAERQTRIAKYLESMSAEERAQFGEVTFEMGERIGFQLDKLAVLLLAGRPLAPHAKAFLGWAMVRAIAHDVFDAHDELAWTLRLNQLDADATRAAVTDLTASVREDSAIGARLGARILLNLLGDRGSALRAEQLVASKPGRMRRRVEMFCETNPHDPAAAPPGNLDNARKALAELNPTQLWQHVGRTVEDGNLEDVTPALARFDPTLLVSTLRRIITTVADRTGTPLRQLAWRLQELAALCTETELSAIRQALDRLLSEPSRVAPEDYNWICCELAAVQMPHLSSPQQFDLLLRLPARSPLYLKLRRALHQLSAEALEAALVAARNQDNEEGLARVLFFAAGTRAALTDKARNIIIDALDSTNDQLSISAADVAFYAADDLLNKMVLESAADSPWAMGPSFYHGRAVAAAVVQTKRRDAVSLVQPRFLSAVAPELNDELFEAVADITERVLFRVLDHVKAEPPQGFETSIDVSADGLQSMGRVSERVEPDDELDVDKLRELADFESSFRRFDARQRQMVESMQTYEKALADEGVSAVAGPPAVKGLASLVEHNPGRARRWVELIRAVDDPRILSQVRNLALAITSAYAKYDGSLAADVLRKLREATPILRINIDGIELYEYAIFSPPDVAELSELREGLFADAYSDQAIEDAVRAGEACGATAWLNEFVVRQISSTSAGDQARGLTVAGLRLANSASDRILAADWGPGFLGQVAMDARKNYQRDSWARHWMTSASNSSDLVDYWRYTQLAEGVVDWRFAIWFPRSQSDSDLGRRFGAEVWERLVKAAEARSKKRGRTLFGIPVPDRDLVQMLRKAG